MNEKMFIGLFEYFEGRQNEDLMREIEEINQKLYRIEGKLNRIMNDLKGMYPEEDDHCEETANNKYNDFGTDFDF